MKKVLTLGAATLAGVAHAAEVATQQPDIWMPVIPKTQDIDIPWIIASFETGDITMGYRPELVNQGYIDFLQSNSIGTWIFASIVLVTILFSLFLMVNGRAKLEAGFSGKLVDRWSIGDVALHWLVALPCLILILTGLALGAGGEWFQGLMGPDRYTAFIKGSVAMHNFFGIPFAIGAIIMMLKWLPRQMPEACDLAWFAKLGGYINIGKTKAEHPDAGFANAGEKAFFWTFVIFGLMLIVSGLMLLYPEMLGGVDKNGANLALILHIIATVVLGAFSVVHVFMGAVMSEGGLENMLSGKCDENWAKQNHNLWYAKVQK